MPLFFIVLALVAIPLMETSIEAGRISQVEARAIQASALGGNMLVIRNSLQTYQQANPSVNGEVGLNSLGLPTWFVPQSDLRVFIENGRAFVFYTPVNTKPDLASVLGTDPPGLTGIAQNAQLISPRLQNNIPLPPIIPDNSIVLML